MLNAALLPDPAGFPDPNVRLLHQQKQAQAAKADRAAGLLVLAAASNSQTSPPAAHSPACPNAPLRPSCRSRMHLLAPPAAGAR